MLKIRPITLKNNFFRNFMKALKLYCKKDLKQLLTTDLLALATMKNAANCDK